MSSTPPDRSLSSLRCGWSAVSPLLRVGLATLSPCTLRKARGLLAFRPSTRSRRASKVLVLERETGFEPATLSLGIAVGESAPDRPSTQGLVSVGFREKSNPPATGLKRPISAPVSGILRPPLRRLRALDDGADNLLSVREVAARLSVTTATVYKLARLGELPHVRVLNALRFEPADLAAFVASQRKAGP